MRADHQDRPVPSTVAGTIQSQAVLIATVTAKGTMITTVLGTGTARDVLDHVHDELDRRMRGEGEEWEF